MCAIGIACQMLMNEQINQILVCRSIISCDNEVGILPGGISSKIEPYVLPYIDYFIHFIGQTGFHSRLGSKHIKITPVELIRGHTYHDTLMILDEAQNCTKKQLKLFFSRIGQNSKIILIGDNKQSDIGENGLEFCIRHMQNMDKIGMIEMTALDVLRHPIIPKIMKIFEVNDARDYSR
jgi:phosphate starvation-inducible PhoH-like protein